MTEGPCELIDISVSVSGTTVTWPGDPKPEIKYVKTIAQGGTSNVSSISTGVHVGTHVDAPLHFIDGAMPVDEIALDVLVGPARVVDMTGLTEIDREHLEAAGIEGAERLLFKTDNSKLWGETDFHEKFVHVTDEGAGFLVERGVKLIAIDYLSVEEFTGRTRQTHKILLGGNVIIIEGVDLLNVEPGDYELICLPIKLAGREAAPARAVLRRQL